MQALWIVLFFSSPLIASAANFYRQNGTENVEAVIIVKPEDMTYYFCNQRNRGGTAVKYNNVNAAKAVFDNKKETVIQVHGWLDGNSAEFNNVVKDAVLSKADVNVIVVDWSKVAKGEYVIVKTQMPKVAAYVGDFIANLAKSLGYPVAKIRLVGHSLGAHISGFVGSHLGGVSQIVGLDPAGPFIGHGLSKGDAKFVEVIHTCGGKLGMSAALGHVDYYPNGGASQPGCGLDVVGRCAHIRSFQLYAESVKRGGFYAKKCSSYKDFQSNKCSGSVSLLGGYTADHKASGSYFLDTNGSPPYAKGQIKEV